MKSMTAVIGLILIIVGIVTLGYQGISYTKREKVAEIGSVQISADKEKHVYFPPILGGAALVAGIVLVVVGRRGN